MSVFFDPKIRKPDPRPLRWRDQAGVVHAMTMCVVKDRGYSGSIWCITTCGQHNGFITFRHPKYCPRPVNCMACIGHVSTLPR